MKFLCPECKVRLYVCELDPETAMVAYCENCERRFRIARKKPAPEPEPERPSVSFSHRAACVVLLVAVLALWAWRQL